MAPFAQFSLLHNPFMPYPIIFGQFEALNVLIVGDIMLDRYLHGHVSRVSPEAPVPVVAWEREENRLGGAANVALNVMTLGARPLLCGIVGDDADGELVRNGLAAQGLDLSGILTSGDRRTTVKTRVMAANQQLLRIDREQTHDLTRTEEDAFLERAGECLSSGHVHVLILQDYNKGVLTKSSIAWLMKRAREKQIPVAVDPKHNNFWEYCKADLFKPNLKEVRDALRLSLSADYPSLRHASGLLRNKLSNRYTLITLSEKGLYLDDADQGQIYPTRTRNVADVSGAGDTVIAIASLALALGLGMDDIALLSNLAGGQVVERVGVVPVDRELLGKELMVGR